VSRNRIILILKLAVAAGLFTWLFTSGKIDFRQLEHLGDRWPWFLVVQIPLAAILFLAAYRWQLFLRAQGIRYRLWDTFALVMIGELFNQFVVGTTGGDIVKAYAVATDHPERRSAGVMSVFVDRAVGLFVLITVALVAILFNWSRVMASRELSLLALLVAAAFVASLVGGYVFYSERIRALSIVRKLLSKLPFRSFLAKISDAVYVYKFHPRQVIGAVVVSFGIHFLVVVVNIGLAHALIPGGFDWLSFFFLIPLAQIAMAVPINPPGAIGTAESFYALLLGMADVPEGFLICLLHRFSYYLWSLLGVVFYIRRKGRVAEAVEAARHEGRLERSSSPAKVTESSQ